MILCDLLLSPSIMFSRPIHVAACLLLYLLSSNHIPLYGCTTVFTCIHSLIDIVSTFANMNNAAINIHMHSFCVDILSVLLGIDLEVESPSVIPTG